MMSGNKLGSVPGAYINEVLDESDIISQAC